MIASVFLPQYYVPNSQLHPRSGPRLHHLELLEVAPDAVRICKWTSVCFRRRTNDREICGRRDIHGTIVDGSSPSVI